MTDFRDYLLRDPLVVDTGRFGALSSSSVTLAGTNPYLGASSLIAAGSIAHTMLTPSSVLGTQVPLSVQYANSAVSSLGVLNASVASLTGLATMAPYCGTVNALVSGAGLAERLGVATINILRVSTGMKLH